MLAVREDDAAGDVEQEEGEEQAESFGMNDAGVDRHPAEVRPRRKPRRQQKRGGQVDVSVPPVFQERKDSDGRQEHSQARADRALVGEAEEDHQRGDDQHPASDAEHPADDADDEP